MSRRFGVLAAFALGASLVGALPATADSGRAFPAEIALPNGFQPEGIAIGDAPTAYFGSLKDGSLLRVDLRNGKSTVFSQGPGTPSVGLQIDKRGRLFVAGGPAGDARVVDSRSGKVLASYQLATGSGAFVNDVTITEDAAWFTDSLRAVVYKVAFGRHGSLPAAAVTIPLTGDFVLQPGQFNSNGITTTPDGKSLLIVQSVTGKLFKVAPATGAATEVALGGELLSNGDGLLRQGNTLYAVQNSLNTMAAVKLNRSGTKGRVFAKVTDPRFDVPTTVASFGNRLYLPNARFGVTPTPDTPYNAVAVRKP